MDSRRVFHIADYVIFIVTIVVSLGIGIFYALSGGRQRTTSEFLVGNRKMSVLPVAISLMVSFESSIMMLGLPAEIYTYGIQWIMAIIGLFVADMASVKIMVPLIYPLKITSAYEYLELRFKSRAVRLLGTFLGIMHYVFYMGIVLFGPAIALEAVQRIASTSSLRDAQKVLLITAPAFLVTFTFAIIEGIVAFAYYYTFRCDPLASKQIRNPNQIIPLLVMDIYRGLPGMPGLFLASLFSASLSTLSSGLSSVSTLFWQDFIKPHTKPMSEFRATIIVKVSVVIFGSISVGIAYLVAQIGGTLTQISGTILSSFGGALAGLFFAGCFLPWVNAKGAFSGCITGVVFVFWIASGKTMSPGVKKTPRLPAAPVDQCPTTNLMNDSLWVNNTSSSFKTSFMTPTMPESAIDP
ncbi:hypothetical protein FSP39_014685 [Pinctada imbricata]|uniref:Uncharacterized protein n=1 Tax=Pinctada imbricata TaxID=66713 RepID=A0AA88Y0K4_PINIB|nr:hypothetical protein FSP39_014685 [Pinctada imbricata]